MEKEKFKAVLEQLDREKLLSYLIEAERRLKLYNKEFAKLYEDNIKLYEKHELIWRMSDNQFIRKSDCNSMALCDLRTYYQNRMNMNDLIAMEFYQMGRKDAFRDFILEASLCLVM